MLRARTLIASLALLAMLETACSKKEEGGEPKKSPDSEAARTETAKPETPPPKAAAAVEAAVEKTKAVDPSSIEADEEVMAEIARIASSCGIEPKLGRIDCRNKEKARLYDELYGYGDKAKTRVATIATVAKALADPDPKIQTVAADLLGSRFSTGWGEGVAVGQVDKGVAALLRETLPKLGQYQARRAVTAVVYASSLSGTDAEMYPILETHPDEIVRNWGWKASMFYGRMNAFDKIKGLAETGDPKKVLAAVTAAANMFDYTDDEKARLCPWAESELGADPEGAKESDVFEKAGYVLTRCGGEWIDKLLDWGEAQREKNVFDRKYYFVYRELCHSVMKGVAEVAATPEQCERNWKFLEATANTEGIAPKFRAWALDSISYSRRDERSYKLMKKYARSKVPEIKKVAQDALKMLESYVKKK